MWDKPTVFSFENIKYFLTHIWGEGRMFFKEIYSNVLDPKELNSWIHNTDFKLF